MKQNLKPKLVAITGGSGSGKTWLAEKLHRAFGANAARISLDDFYRDLGHLSPARRATANFDHPRAIDWDAFETVLRDCAAGRTARVPRYDFTTHTRRTDFVNFNPAPLIIVEGLWLLWRARVRNCFDLKIFIDCSARLRLQRRLARDVAERGRTPQSVRRQFSATVAPMHGRFVAPQSAGADIVLQQPFDESRPLERIKQWQLEPTAPRSPGKTASRAQQLSIN